MLRILHIVTYMGRGGLETMIMNYYRNVDRTKVQFDFLVHRNFKADYDDEIEDMGGVIYRLPTLNPLSRKYLKALKTFFQEHRQYSVVHSHLDCLSAIPLKVAKDSGVPVRIAHSHTSNQDKNLKYLIKRYYRRKIPNVTTNLLACSDDAGKWMFGDNKYEILPNAIDANKYIYNELTRNEMRKEFDLNDDIVVGHVGRFDFVKNHIFLIQVFNEIKKKLPKARLLLVGDGERRFYIEQEIEKLGLSNSVIFTGVRTDVDKILQVMDVFVFPSLYEGLPVTLIEAQAAGLPCIISDKVPIECKKTHLVKQVSLSEEADVWAKEAILALEISRENTYSQIKISGFDIQENARGLQEFYLELSRGEKDVCLY